MNRTLEGNKAAITGRGAGFAYLSSSVLPVMAHEISPPAIADAKSRFTTLEGKVAAVALKY
jgi:hypothetical protein